jgi:lysophospholipase L1-like esterase
MISLMRGVRRHPVLLWGVVMWIPALLMAEVALRWMDVVDPPVYEDHAQFGYLMRPDQSVSTRGIRFRINNLGFRGHDVAGKPEGTIRMAFVGDSVTYGGGSMREEDLFVNRVAAELTRRTRTRHEALNMGVSGWGPQNMAAYIAARGVHQSNWIVWVISTVDFRRHKTNRIEHGLWASKPPSRFLYGVTAMLHKSGLVRRADASAPPPPGPAVLEQNVAALQTSLRHTLQRGLRHAVVVIPIEAETSQTASDARRFARAAESLDVPFLHLGERFQAAGVGDLFEDGIHLTAKGHAVVATAVVTGLMP